MAGALAEIPVNRQNSDEINRFLDGTATFVDAFFQLTEDGNESSPEIFHQNYSVVDNEEEDDENSCNSEENRLFWETQEQLLQATLCRTSSLESKIRQATKEALKEVMGGECGCSRRLAAGDCRNCLRNEICVRLQNAGYNCAICKSKWRSSPEIPSGEHIYLEVMDKSSSKKAEIIRIVIELSFRGEFEMARASEEYKRLVRRLPEIFVGKSERLKTLVKILCGAAKKCMKDKKIHMGPWRKYKYVQAKWFGTCERSLVAPKPAPKPAGWSNRPEKPQASMLTFDLLELENLAGMRCPVVTVV